MNIYWTMSSVPELSDLPKDDQKKLYVTLQKEGRKRLGWQPYALLAGSVVVCVMLFVVTGFVNLISMALMGGMIGLAFAVFIQTPAIDRGREWLAEQNGRH